MSSHCEVTKDIDRWEEGGLAQWRQPALGPENAAPRRSWPYQERGRLEMYITEYKLDSRCAYHTSSEALV